MPRKNIIRIKIQTEQPDCCTKCPMLGLIPKYRLQPGSQETHICIPTRHAMSARLTRSKRSEADAKHPRHRWCDDFWEAWREKGFRGIPRTAYIEERIPWEDGRQLPIIFHSKRGRKPKGVEEETEEYEFDDNDNDE